jgi:hypothetical protein
MRSVRAVSLIATSALCGLISHHPCMAAPEDAVAGRFERAGAEGRRAQATPGTSATPETSGPLGAATSNLVYNPLPPCRVLDTRSGSGAAQIAGPLAANTTYAIQVSSLCDVPNDAAAVMLNFVAVAPGGAGDLRAWPWDSSNPAPPNSSILNYGNVSGLNIANGLVVSICNPGTATGGICTDDLFVRPDAAGTHLVIDVLGYFVAPVVPPLTCITVSAAATLGPGAHDLIDSPSCGTSNTLAGGGCTGSASGETVLTDSFQVLDLTGQPIWRCFYTNTSGSASFTVTAQARCCQMPGWTCAGVARPAPTGVEPSSGPAGGGTTVDVKGLSFVPVKDQVLWGATATSVRSGSTATDLLVAVPPFTGSFPTAPCSAAGATGVMNLPAIVDVSITDAVTGCAGTLPGGFTYIPSNTSCQIPPPPPPRASFTETTVPGSLTVIFSDTSTGNPTSFSWSFGDETTSNVENPVHTYPAPGAYTVTLTVSNGVGVSSISQVAVVTSGG